MPAIPPADVVASHFGSDVDNPGVADSGLKFWDKVCRNKLGFTKKLRTHGAKVAEM
jgi:hypothetical protein